VLDHRRFVFADDTKLVRDILDTLFDSDDIIAIAALAILGGLLLAAAIDQVRRFRVARRNAAVPPPQDSRTA
jgi:hypothetical protein